MSTSLILCADCHRHHRAADPQCPFCHQPTSPVVRVLNLVGGAVTTVILAACYGGGDYTTKFDTFPDDTTSTGDTGLTTDTALPVETGDTGTETGDTGTETGDTGTETGDTGTETGDTSGSGAPTETGDTGFGGSGAPTETGDTGQ